MSNSTHIIGYGPDGGQGENRVGYTASATGASGPTGATGPAGGIGSTGPTGFGFGYSGDSTSFSDWKFVELLDDQTTLRFVLGGSAGSQIAGFDNSITVTGFRGPTGASGENGELLISTLVTGASGASILRSISGSSADFKTINTRSDVEIIIENGNTVVLKGVKENSADSVDAGRTGELLVMVAEDYADGATGTFFNLSSYPNADSSTNKSLDTLSLQKSGSQKEIVKRHGTPNRPVGFESASRVDVDISYKDANVHLIHCGPTTGFINFPDPSEIESVGTTFGRQEELTIILEHGSNHGLVTGNMLNDFCRSVYRPTNVNVAIFNGLRSNIFAEEGRNPYCVNVGDSGQGQSNSPCNSTNDPDVTCTGMNQQLATGGLDSGNDEVITIHENGITSTYYSEGNATDLGVKLLKDLKFSNGYDMFTFSAYNSTGWRLHNPTLGITGDTSYSLSKDDTGSCCEFNASGEYLKCNDYVLESECRPELKGPEVDSIRFTPYTLCELSGCEGVNEGACCTMGTCVQSDRETCNLFSGFFVANAVCGQGGLDCNDYPCDTPILPTGACCLEDSDGCHSCIDVTEDQCAVCGGDFKGYGTPCSSDPCDPSPDTCKYGACCSFSPLNPGVRQCNEVTEDTCINSCLNGLYYGDDSTCCTTLYPRDGIYIGAYCDGESVQIIYGESTEDVESQIPSTVTDSCKNIILWNSSSPYPQSWVPGFATQDFESDDGSQIHLPSVSRGVCQAAELGLCPNCDCLSQAVDNRDQILGTCCLPYRIPVEGNISCDYIPNFDNQTCIQVGGTWYAETAEELDLNCSEGRDCNENVGSDDPNCVDCDVKGACCIGGNCSYISGDECDALGGVFQGEGTNCETVECCNFLTGPCCLNDGQCIETHPFNCNLLGGVFNGVGLSCDDDSFSCCSHQDVEVVRGACCCEGCPCAENLTAAECQNRNGVDGCSNCVFYRDTSCFDVPCIDFECRDECLSQPEDRVAWYIFTLPISTGASYFNSGPISWGNTNFNYNATAPGGAGSIADEFLPPITRRQDGFYNSHGWYWSWGVGDDDEFNSCEWDTEFNTDSTVMRKSGPLTYPAYGGYEGSNTSKYKNILDKYWDDDTAHSSVREKNYAIASGGLVQPIVSLSNDFGSAPTTIWEQLQDVNEVDSPRNDLIYKPAGHITSSTIHPIFQSENLYIPSKQELHFLYYQRESNPFLKTQTNYMQGNIWSSSAAEDDMSYVFYQNIDNGDVGIYQVFDHTNPQASWPHVDQISISANPVYFYRVMEGSQEYTSLGGAAYFNSLVPGNSAILGLTRTRELIYVGKFTPGCNEVYGTDTVVKGAYLPSGGGDGVDQPLTGEQVCSNKLPEGSCCECNGCSDTSASQYTCLHKRNNETWPDHPENKIKSAKVKRWKADSLKMGPGGPNVDIRTDQGVNVINTIKCDTNMETSDNLYPFFWSCNSTTENNVNARNYYNGCLEKGVCCNSSDPENPTFVPECQCVGTDRTWFDTNGTQSPDDPVNYCNVTPEVTSTCCRNSSVDGPITSCQTDVAEGDCNPIAPGNVANWGGVPNQTCIQANCVESLGSCCFGYDGNGDGSYDDYECIDAGGSGFYIGDCQDPATAKDALESIGVPPSRSSNYDFVSFNSFDAAGPSLCTNNPCPTDTIGRCCKYDINGEPIDVNGDSIIDCEELTFVDCVEENGGQNNNSWVVGNCSQSCGTIQPDVGACCESIGGAMTCSQKTQSECQDSGGTFQDVGVPCVPDPCPPPPPPPVFSAECCDDNGDGMNDYICVNVALNNDALFNDVTGQNALGAPAGFGCSITQTANGVVPNLIFTGGEVKNSPYGIYAKVDDNGNIIRKTTPDLMTYGCPCSWWDVNAFPYEGPNSESRTSPNRDVKGIDNIILFRKDTTYTAHSPSDCAWIKQWTERPPLMEADYHGDVANSDLDSNACQVNCCELGAYAIANQGLSINSFADAANNRAVYSAGYQYGSPLPFSQLIPTNSQSSYHPLPQGVYLRSFTEVESIDEEKQMFHNRQAMWDYVDFINGDATTYHTQSNYTYNSFMNGYGLAGLGRDPYPVGFWVNASGPGELQYGYHLSRDDSNTTNFNVEGTFSNVYNNLGTKKFRDISGVSTNRFAHVCVPYKGLFNVDGENWWSGNGPQNYYWELPAQPNVDDAVGLNPSMARRVAFSYNTITIFDRFQMVQLPWPKDARTKEEAQERIQLYLKHINLNVLISPMSNNFGELPPPPPPQNNIPEQWEGAWTSETVQKRSNTEDPLWILQDPMSTNAHGRGIDSAPDANEIGEWEYLNGIVMTNRPFVYSNGDSYAWMSILATIRNTRFNENQRRKVPDGSDMLYHGRAAQDVQALSVAEKYLGYAAEQHWIMYDSGCVSTYKGERLLSDGSTGQPFGVALPGFDPDNPLDGAYQDCAYYVYPSCPLRLDARQVEGHQFANRNAQSQGTVQQQIKKRMQQGYGPGGQGPISPITIGISGCATQDWGGEGEQIVNWDIWPSRAAGSVYSVMITNCGGGYYTLQGSSDDSGVAMPGGRADGLDVNQTNCGKSLLIPPPSNGYISTDADGDSSGFTVKPVCDNGC